VNSLCCSEKTKMCHATKCANCSEKLILFNEVDGSCEISYYEWKSEKAAARSKKRKKDVLCNEASEVPKMQVTVNALIKDTVMNVISLLETSVYDYMSHLYRINHHFEVLKLLKENLSENDLVLHVDFSENYVCKLAKETQGMHFGGSRPSVTLHTGVAYSRDFKQSFCTISESERHDAAAIAAHLTPILGNYLRRFPFITRLHILSDGPTNQYRSKYYFCLLTQYIT